MPRGEGAAATAREGDDDDDEKEKQREKIQVFKTFPGNLIRPRPARTPRGPARAPVSGHE